MDFISEQSRKLADYIYSDLSPEEAVNMAAQIGDNPELAESYRTNMKVKDYLKVKVLLEEMRSDPFLPEAENLADQVLNPVARMSPAPPAKQGVFRSGRNRIFIGSAVIAAAIALLLAIGYISSAPEPAQLYRQYYTVFNASDYTQRGNHVNDLKDLRQGINSYKGGLYQQSILLFSNLDGSSPAIREEKLFFTGLSHMGLSQFEEAAVILEELSGITSRYLPETIWYLGLCQLQLGDIEQARALFARLDVYDGYYKTQSQSLLKELRHIR